MEREFVTPKDVAVLIYDGNCPLCRNAVNWCLKEAKPGTLEALACQSDERARLFPQISLEACMESVQLVWSDGSVFAGADSIPHLLRLMPRWKWTAPAFHLPGVKWAAPHVYHFVARHRGEFSRLFPGSTPYYAGACKTGECDHLSRSNR